jgi:hypothetical protein
VVHVRNHGHVADVGRQVHDGAHLVDCERKKGQGGLSGRFLCLMHPVVASACSRAGASNASWVAVHAPVKLTCTHGGKGEASGAVEGPRERERRGQWGRESTSAAASRRARVPGYGETASNACEAATHHLGSGWPRPSASEMCTQHGGGFL